MYMQRFERHYFILDKSLSKTFIWAQGENKNIFYLILRTQLEVSDMVLILLTMG